MWNDDRGQGDRVLPVRDGDHAGMARRAERIRERTDVIQAVGGKIAVVDEKDVHTSWSNL